MYSKKLIWAMLAGFIFVSFASFYANLPAPKNKRVYEAILPYFPYKIKKELGGLDIEDVRKHKDLNIDNAKVYLIYDQLLQKWGQSHLQLQGNNLLIFDDQKRVVKKVALNSKEKEWVKNFFKF